MAVIVLVKRSVSRVGIPCLGVIVSSVSVSGIKRFIILEYGIFAFPRPDCGSYSSYDFCLRRIVVFTIIRRINLPCHTVRHIVLYQRAVAIHRCNRVSTGILDIVISNNHVRGTVRCNIRIRNLFISRIRKLFPVCGISNRNSPAVYIVHNTIFNPHVVITGNPVFGYIFTARFLCVVRQEHREINPSVIHMLIVYVSDHVMYIQPVQVNMVQRPPVLCDGCHTGTIHHIDFIIFRLDCRSPVYNFQVPDLNVFRIIEQNRRRNVSLVFVIRIIQPVSVILIPYAFPVCIDHRQRPFAVFVNDNRRFLASALSEQMQISVRKYGTAF